MRPREGVKKVSAGKNVLLEDSGMRYCGDPGKGGAVEWDRLWKMVVGRRKASTHPVENSCESRRVNFDRLKTRRWTEGIRHRAFVDVGLANLSASWADRGRVRWSGRRAGGELRGSMVGGGWVGKGDRSVEAMGALGGPELAPRKGSESRDGERVIISTPMKNHMLIDHEYVNCPLRFDDRIRPANLLPIHMLDFDVILGMDWLASHRATIDCYARTVIFGNVRQPEFVYHGSSPLKSVKLISAMKARTLISHGCQGFLASVMDTSLESPNIENLSVVREFADVFPDELPGLPPAREIEFGIELIPGAEPISKAPYRMAPVELKELKEQLQEIRQALWIIKRLKYQQMCRDIYGDSILLNEKGEKFVWTVFILMSVRRVLRRNCEKEIGYAPILIHQLVLIPILHDLERLDVELCVRGSDGYLASMRIESNSCYRSKSSKGRWLKLTSKRLEFVTAVGDSYAKWDENISHGFVSGLPHYQKRHDAIWVVVDRLTSLLISYPIEKKYGSSKFGGDFSKEMFRLDERKLGKLVFKFSTYISSCKSGQSAVVATVEICIWHASIKAAPFELLYGRKCRAPICWDEVGERLIEGPELIEITNEKVAVAKEKLKRLIATEELC
ncbi:putative reverse transcriptase domain-containing protein [Tanacetum coccineum]|uniref:Reverse transcriptase domain-containing protein n=1 Tax=Tanacetum coccineum TaxID=301880 RepID=A0ABQ5BSS8_9ASTR